MAFRSQAEEGGSRRRRASCKEREPVAPEALGWPALPFRDAQIREKSLFSWLGPKICGGSKVVLSPTAGGIRLPEPGGLTPRRRRLTSSRRRTDGVFHPSTLGGSVPALTL